MELTVQMVPMLILAALASGWVADAAIAPGGRGLRIDMAVGLAGSGVTGGLLWSVTGQTAFAMLAMFIAGSGGAAAAIAVQRHFWPRGTAGAEGAWSPTASQVRRGRRSRLQDRSAPVAPANTPAGALATPAVRDPHSPLNLR